MPRSSKPVVFNWSKSRTRLETSACNMELCKVRGGANWSQRTDLCANSWSPGAKE